ncbi:sensor histidine kinase [Paenibacillus sp. OV219]|uniref:sensor histidine kinase n=1 Tax=Paenibacillus sp. OV219 TaxID=1884377 RepID=UPI0008C92DBB|nr:histidine kinase [Paenibacillus sp. OV219]SEO90655.1 two-component system, sensor histidine kinase YesM [Paenibacillus sp. OV219]
MIRNSIRKKLIFFLLAATIIPIGASIAVSNLYTKRSVTDATINENSSRLELGKNNIASYFNTINQLSLSVYGGINAADSLYTYLEKSISKPVSSNMVATSHDLVYLHLFSLSQASKDIYQLHLFIPSGSQSNLWINGFFRREYNPSYKMPLARDRNGEANPFIEPTHMNTQYGMQFSLPESKTTKEPVITLHRPIYMTPTKMVIALLSVDLKMDSFNRICGQLYNQNGRERLAITDEAGSYLYSSEAEEYGKKLTQNWSVKLAQTSGSGHFVWKDDLFSGIIFYDHLDTPYMKATIIKQIKYSDLYSTATALTRINTLIAGGFLLIALIGTVFISFQLTEPIKRLIGYMNRVQAGNLSAPLEVRNTDEIGLLARKMQSMMETIDQLILQEYRLELANKTNQLKALQAQINPHFLYNAMQSIGTQALQGNAHKTYSLITLLAKMMRYSMTTDETEVRLEREVQHVLAYLDLQKERFGEQLHVETSFSPETMNIVVPKMLLQPIVENYFKHGYTGGVQTGEIRITSAIQDEMLVLEIMDNGKGIESDELARLAEMLTGEQDVNVIHTFTEEAEGSVIDKSGSIGLMNVIARLRLYNGQDAQIKLDKRLPAGLSVTVLIPLAKGGIER